MKQGFNEKGMMAVRENHCCDHFEPDDEALVPMRECWCCKWAEFDTEKSKLHEENLGFCRYEGNMIEVG